MTYHQTDRIKQELSNCIRETDLPFSSKYRGKVRDTYDLDDRLLIVTTDRQSAFDRFLAAVPFKGQVLNQCSAWWFEQSREIVANHLISVPDPNVSLVKKGKVFPVEFVVRAYITGSTQTSLWTQYAAGVREYCGHHLPEGLVKNQPLSHIMLTPTSKEEEHDRPLSPQQIISEGWMTEKDWQEASQAALRLFSFGAQKAFEKGLILVDTKYEFARDEQGQLMIVDELHTPDSSRYWLAESYQSRFEQGLEPESIDKEFLRLWFAKHCDPYHDKVLPEAPEDLICELSARYIRLYEMITGFEFQYSECSMPATDRIYKNLQRQGLCLTPA